MIILAPGRENDFDLGKIKSDQRKISGEEYIFGTMGFARELGLRLNHSQENSRNESNNVKIINKEMEEKIESEVKNRNNKEITTNTRDTKVKKQSITHSSIIEKKAASENDTISYKELKQKNIYNTLNSLSKNELKEIKNMILAGKKNKLNPGKSLKAREEKTENNKKSKYNAVELKFIRGSRKKFLKKLSLRFKVKNHSIKDSLKNSGKDKKASENATIKNEKIKTEKQRRHHLSVKKIKLNLKNKHIHKSYSYDFNKKLDNDTVKEEISQKFSAKSAGVSLKNDAFVISKKYDFHMLEVSGKTDNHIHRTADEIFGDIVKHFTFVVKQGGGEAKISLYPPELGKIKMSIKLQNGKVSTFFLVDNPSVKEIIDARLNVLQQNLLDQGFSLGSFDVGVKDESGNLDDFKNFADDLGRKFGTQINQVNNISGEQDENMLQAVLPWLSSYVNITV